MMLAGFTSRWTMPAAWASASASATSAPDAAASSGVIGPSRREAIGQRLAVDQLHHDVGPRVLLAVVEDAGDVRVGEPRGGPGLAPEPLDEPVVVGEALVEHLHGDRPPERRVLGFPHRAHAAPGERLDQAIPVPEDDVRVRARHGTTPR